MEILEMIEECNKVHREEYVSRAAELILDFDSEHLSLLNEAFAYCKENMCVSKDDFIENYLFGTYFYAYCAGRMPGFPISDVFNFLSAKKNLYLAILN